MIELFTFWFTYFSKSSLTTIAFIIGIFVALTTSLGSLLSLFSKKIPSWGIDLSLSFAAGVMLVASFTSLILPAIEISNSFLPTAIGILLGLLLMYLVDRLLPHEHFVKGYEGPKELQNKLKTAWLLTFAMVIHNFPEGLAIGTVLNLELKKGLITALAIGIQDLPEGIVVSLPLATLKKKSLEPFLLGLLSGLVEFVSVLTGVHFFKNFPFLLPYGLSLAGGAMLFVTVKEVIPEIYNKQKNEPIISLGFFLGFYVMLFLDSIRF